MGIAPRLLKHFDSESGFEFIHQLGTVMFETTADQLLCADCASGRNGSLVTSTEFGLPDSPQWDVVNRRFLKEEEWIECDHCRVRVASWYAITMNDDEEEFHDGLAFNPDKALFHYSRETDIDAVRQRLVDIFATTNEIKFVQGEKFNHALVSSRRRKIVLEAFAEETLTSRVDGTSRTEPIRITRHLLSLLENEMGELSSETFQRIVFKVKSADEVQALTDVLCDKLHTLILAPAKIPRPKPNFVKDT